MKSSIRSQSRILTNAKRYQAYHALNNGAATMSFDAQCFPSME